MEIKDIEQRLVGRTVVRHDSGRVPNEQRQTFTIKSVERHPQHAGLFLVNGTGGVLKLWGFATLEQLALTKRVTMEYNDGDTIQLARAHGLMAPPTVTTNTIVYTLEG